MSDNTPQVTAPVGTAKPIPAPAVRLVSDATVFAQNKDEPISVPTAWLIPEIEADLVKMAKGAETLFVHPTAVASHELVGWVKCP